MLAFPLRPDTIPVTWEGDGASFGPGGQFPFGKGPSESGRGQDGFGEDGVFCEWPCGGLLTREAPGGADPLTKWPGRGEHPWENLVGKVLSRGVVGEVGLQDVLPQDRLPEEGLSEEVVFGDAPSGDEPAEEGPPRVPCLMPSIVLRRW